MVSIFGGFMVKKGLFLEKNKYTYIFDGGHFFKIEKKLLIYKKDLSKKIFILKIFWYQKNFYLKKFF